MREASAGPDTSVGAPGTIGVLGAGAVGRAVASRLVATGHTVVAGDQEDEAKVLAAAGSLLVTALTHGTQTQDVLERGRLRCRQVLDLTTHSAHSASRCRKAAEAAGIGYHGGGLTGGARQVADGSAVLLMGPAPTGPAASACRALGTVVPFDSAECGAQAKLLHNWVLIVQQWAASIALAAADAAGVRDLPAVLMSGTAGRPVSEWSVVRDREAPQPSSTYLSRLVAKDLQEIRRSLPTVAQAGESVLTALDGIFSADDDRPYTAALARQTNRAEERFSKEGKESYDDL